MRSGAGGEQIEYRARVERVLEESKEATKRKVLSRRCRKQEHEKKKKQKKKQKKKNTGTRMQMRERDEEKERERGGDVCSRKSFLLT